MITKFVFVTGGVISSIGKGIVSASLGAILGAYGYKISIRKLDPYLNIDPGTVSPIQHGEVFVTDDGGETDLDLGHYERFTGTLAKKTDNTTSGKIYQKLIEKERRGDYLGSTVQVIPHVTDLIKEFILYNASDYHFVICEIGGTVGDIESQPFLEAIRQLSREVGRDNALFIHTTLVPYVGAADECKTKPTQHSVKELMHHGIEPDILVCRVGRPLPMSDRKKISIFCNVDVECVIEAPDVQNIYEVPIIYHENGLGNQVMRLCGFKNTYDGNAMHKWSDFVTKMRQSKQCANIAIVRKYSTADAYKSLAQALIHAGANSDIIVNIKWIDAQEITDKNVSQKLKDVDAVIVPGGFDKSGIDGKILAIRYAREEKIPFLGICLGMQLAVLEFARNVLNIKGATSEEFLSDGNEYGVDCLVISLKKWIDRNGSINITSPNEGLGGTMRLGSYNSLLLRDTLARYIYNADSISERHRHRYEIDINYQDLIESHGMKFSSFSSSGMLPEIIELSNFSNSTNNHPFFLGCQFHPEFKSTPFNPHPIFTHLLKVALSKK